MTDQLPRYLIEVALDIYHGNGQDEPWEHVPTSYHHFPDLDAAIVFLREQSRRNVVISFRRVEVT